MTFVTMAFILAIPNITDAMTGNIADPVIQTIAYHLGSGFERPLLILIAFGFMGSMVALHIAGSRTLYAFGRDKMIPGSRIFTRAQSIAGKSAVGGPQLHRRRYDRHPAHQPRRREGLRHAPAHRGRGLLHLVCLRGHLAAGASREEAPFPRPLQPGSLELRRSRPSPRSWIVFEIINLMWPRDSSLPWYQNWGVITSRPVLTVAGLIVFLISPRHEGHVGAPPKEEIAEGAAFAEQPAD